MSNLESAQHNISLAPYTTYKIGGPAELFIEVHSAAELAEAVTASRAAGLPYFILGTGANILITDKGIKGVVILNKAARIEFHDNTVTAESGATIAQLIKEAAARGLSGLEHFAGIPSSVGGALWQNLHFLSPDRSRTVFIEEVVSTAQLLDEHDHIQVVEKSFFNFGYDESVLRERPLLTALSATFLLNPEDPEIIQQRIEANLSWRNERQPQVEDYPSCGSVFKKIEGVGAGRLIEQAGMKGYRLGGVQVSEKHANFLVNTGNAKAEDVLNLISLIQKKVKDQTGYDLEPEIHIVGER